MNLASYPTDLTDAQRVPIQSILPTPSKRGRPTIDRRRIINALLYMAKGSIQWCLLPHDFPAWKTVYSSRCHKFLMIGGV